MLEIGFDIHKEALRKFFPKARTIQMPCGYWTLYLNKGRNERGRGAYESEQLCWRESAAKILPSELFG